ncbi:hypothetical protein GPALN_015060 [Globodera pallida]|nr:hypothetical protein GPALN_015060 [Globodera pallida]
MAACSRRWWMDKSIATFALICPTTSRRLQATGDEFAFSNSIIVEHFCENLTTNFGQMRITKSTGRTPSLANLNQLQLITLLLLPQRLIPLDKSNPIQMIRILLLLQIKECSECIILPSLRALARSLRYTRFARSASLCLVGNSGGMAEEKANGRVKGRGPPSCVWDALRASQTQDGG